MRVNVYNEELTDEVEVVREPRPGRVFIGVRFLLESSDRLHHTEDDDDRSSVTLWVGTPQKGLALLNAAKVALQQDRS